MKFFVIALLLGLSFLLALLPFTQGKVDRYRVNIDEKGTRFSEEIAVDEKGDEAVFRVPSHNNIDGANFYHDFKMRVTITRIPSRKVCYISEMDSSLTSSRKLKEDLERASSQTGELPVTTKSNLMMVTVPANKLFLTQKVLDFCGILPIYKVKAVDKHSLINGTRGAVIRHRIARQTTVTSYAQCSRNAMTYIASCMNANWDLSCKMQTHNSYYFVRCENQRRVHRWKCTKVHVTTGYPVCCDLICPLSIIIQ